MDLDQCLPKVKWENDVFQYRNRLVLTNTILLILTKHPHLYYYQGYYDILSVIQITMHDPLLSYSVSEAVTGRFLGDMMQKEFQTVTLTLPLILTVIKEADVELYDLLVGLLCMPRPPSDDDDDAEVDGGPTEDELTQAVMFSLCNYITWFSHDIKRMSQICWLFDVFIAMPPDYAVYFVAALVISFRDEIIALAATPDDEPAQDGCKDGFGRSVESEGCDYATMYTFLLNLSRQPKRPDSSVDDENSSGVSPEALAPRELDLFHLIEICDTLYQHIYPPAVLLSHVLHPVPGSGSDRAHRKCAQLIKDGTITIFNYLYDKKNVLGCHSGALPTFESDSTLLMRSMRRRRCTCSRCGAGDGHQGSVVTAVGEATATLCKGAAEGDIPKVSGVAIPVAPVAGTVVGVDAPSPRPSSVSWPLVLSTALHGIVLYCLLFTESPSK
jgi:hypothetical protein